MLLKHSWPCRLWLGASQEGEKEGSQSPGSALIDCRVNLGGEYPPASSDVHSSSPTTGYVCMLNLVYQGRPRLQGSRE
jgi:hypothetical protein